MEAFPNQFGRMRIFINIFMLKTTTGAAWDNCLAFSGLQNVPFRLPKRAVSQAKTGRIAVQNVSFQNVRRHIRKIKTIAAVF